jgi:plasmid stability protein
MSTQTLTLNVPAPLYGQLKQCADASARSIEEELLELLTSALADHTVPRDLAETVASLSSLDDAQLWQAARSRLTEDALHELEALHLKRQREGLLSHERQRAEELERLFERIVLLRSQAAVVLRQRGHDVTSLVAS